MKEKIISGIVLFIIIFFAATFFSLLILSMFPAEDNVIIDGDDVVSYNIINEDKIEIIMNDDIIYIIDLGFDDDIVDFTIDSDIYIKLERFDTRVFWWDFIISTEPVYPDEYRIGRIIKTPSEDR